MADDLREWARKKRQETEQEQKTNSWNVPGIIGGVLAVAAMGGASYYLMTSGSEGSAPSRDSTPHRRSRRSRRSSERRSKRSPEKRNDDSVEDDAFNASAYEMKTEYIPVEEDV